MKKLFNSKSKLSKEEPCRDHSLQIKFDCETAPLEGGGWTMFSCGTCPKCGAWGGFPDYNFNLAVLNGIPELKEGMRLNGIPVDELANKLRLRMLANNTTQIPN